MLEEGRYKTKATMARKSLTPLEIENSRQSQEVGDFDSDNVYSETEPMLSVGRQRR